MEGVFAYGTLFIINEYNLEHNCSAGNKNEDIHYITKHSNVTKINSAGQIRCHSCLRLQEPVY